MPLDTELPFALSPEAAIEWFRQKSLLLTFSAAQLLAEERATAFTVAGLMDLALLETVRDAVDRALDEGTTPVPGLANLSAETCGACHVEQLADWKLSTHSSSSRPS